MGLFITGLFISMIFLIACIFFAFKAYKRKKEIEKIIPFDRTERRRNRGNSNRKKDNYSLLLSVTSAIFSIFVMIWTLLNAVPAPTIYPLDNEARVYSETANVIISTINLPFFHTYYTLDGSDPEFGYIYEDVFTITKTTTVSAKTKFLIFWSDLDQNTFRFESAQNITVNHVDNADDEHITIADIFTYALVFLIFCAIFVPVIRGDK